MMTNPKNPKRDAVDLAREGVYFFSSSVLLS